MFPWLSDRRVREYAKAASRYYEILRERERREMTNKDHIERTKRMIEVMQAYVDGEEIETCYGVVDNPNWEWDYVDKYRIAKTPDSINWDHVAPEFKYMARDADGKCWLYEKKPAQRKCVWDQDSSMWANGFSSYRKGTRVWKDSLVIRPGCE